MNRQEFEQQLGAEPRSNDPDFVAARRRSVELAGLARDALAFEDKLEAAIKLPVGEDVADQVLAYVRENEPAAANPVSARPGWMRVLPIAASVAAIFALGIMIGRNSQPSPLADAFAEHVTHETFALDLSDPIALGRVQAAFAAHGAEFQLAADSKVTYMSKCVIGDQVGIHLVVVDANGEHSTVMYLPDQPDVRDAAFEAGDIPAQMFRTADGGVSATFAHDGQSADARFVL